MIQSITFWDEIEITSQEWVMRGKNTWTDWKLLPTERPVFASPPLKTTYLDVPGGNGSLDLSESLARFPTYNNRTGSFIFRVMNGYMPWQQRYEDVLEFLHGRAMRATLYDDPDWFYQGRFSIDEWASGDTWSEITIGYTVNPFKWSILTSTEPWVWDPFNFEKGIILEDTFSQIELNSPSAFEAFEFSADFFGNIPISPRIRVNGTTLTIKAKFVNTYLGIDQTVTLKPGDNDVPDFIFYGQTSPYKMEFEGVGVISIDFRVGRL